MSKTSIGGAVCRDFESEAPAAEMLERIICSCEQFSFQMCLEGSDSSGMFRRWRHGAISDGASVISSGRVFQTRGPATVQTLLPTIENLTGGTSRQLELAERSVHRPGWSATRARGPRYRGSGPLYTYTMARHVGYMWSIGPCHYRWPWVSFRGHIRYWKAPHDMTTAWKNMAYIYYVLHWCVSYCYIRNWKEFTVAYSHISS